MQEVILRIACTMNNTLWILYAKIGISEDLHFLIGVLQLGILETSYLIFTLLYLEVYIFQITRLHQYQQFPLQYTKILSQITPVPAIPFAVHDINPDYTSTSNSPCSTLYYPRLHQYQPVQYTKVLSTKHILCSFIFRVLVDIF